MNNIQLSQSFPIWIAVIILVISFAIVIFSYYRTDKPLNRRYRYALIALRILAIGLILFCLLDPTIIMREETIKKSNILVLIDDSQSMSLTDSGEKTARIDDVNKALLVPPSNGRTDTSKDGFKSIIESLDEHFNTQLYQFSSEVTPVKELSLKAQGNLTDIGKAITKTFDDWKGQPVAGIVLITDGSHNSGEDPVRSAQKAGVPIYTVGVGQTKMPRDISVSRVEVSPVAYVDHALPIRVAISSNGYDGREVRITLNQSDNFGSLSVLPLLGGTRKDSASLKLDSRLGEQIVDLQTKPQQEGTIKFTVSVSSAPDELTQQNNTYTFFVKVVKTKLKVLYVEGSPRWESTFLNRTLQRDPNVDVTYLITTKQGGYYPQFPPKTFPDTKSVLPLLGGTRNELSSYDVIILGDISPGSLKNEQLGMIKDFIENRGGSILFLGGLKSYGDGGFGESTLRDMLPIDIGQSGAKQIKTPFNPVLTQQGMTHPITRLSDDPQENTAIWRDLPPISRFYSGIGTKSGATVLTENQQEKRPFIIFQRYGKGMVLMIAGDDLWQWAFGAYPFGGDDSYYHKFWSGTIRWLASVRIQADQVSVTTSKQTYSRDEKVRVKAYVYNENYDPVNNAQIKAQVQTPAKATRDLIFTLEENGRYSAEFSPTMDGNYKIDVEALFFRYSAEREQRNGSLIGKSSTEFIVQTATLEFLNTQLNEPLLKEIADISGGSYNKINDISNLPSSIKETKDKVISIRERSIWDNAIVLIIVMALLTTEWLIRKKKGLV